jgi:predicted transcriptional regulator
MEVHFSPEQQAKLTQIATKAGTAPERLVANVVARYLEEEARFLAAVEKGIAAAERGDFIEEEEMDVRLKAMFEPDSRIQTQEMLKDRYDDVQSGRVKPISSEEIVAHFREKSAAARRSVPGS